MPSALSFLNAKEQQIVIDAIAQAELHTSGEIRLHLDNFCFVNEVKAAQKVFTRLKMHETAERNGVLIYVATYSRKVAVIGDSGIHEKLGADYWNDLVKKMITQLKSNNKVEALSSAILECGKQLGTFFPRKKDDSNELTNSISY